MKRFILAFSLAALAFSGNASAQYDPRVDAARFAEDQNRMYRGDNEYRDDREFGRNNARAGWEIDKLNSEVRRLQYEIRGIRSDRLRARFDRLHQETDRLTALYRRNRIRSWEARRRAEDLRGDAARLREMLQSHRR